MSSTLNHSTMAPNVPMDRDERVRRFGIECIGPAGDGIFFRAGTWRPGGEYIQKLIIRNVSTSVKKLKYKLPSTRYFSMAYPDPIVLSPGLSQEVDVVFRPVEYEPYDDTIYIKMLDGISGNGFHIPVRATIDKLSLTAPDGLDFGYCTTHQTSYLTFLLVNDGEIDAPYTWQVPSPFVFTPSSGVVPVGQAHEITISLMPTDASVYVSKAVCVVGQGVHAIIPNPTITTKLSAIAKFPYITLSDAEVSFDEVVSGMVPDKKEVVLYNNSVVPAEFELVRFDADRDEVFTLTPTQGIIPPKSEVSIIITYNPLSMGTYTKDRYAFRTPSQCYTILTLKGLSMPPKVTLFKDTPPGTLSTSPKQLLESAGSVFMEEEGSPLFSLNFRDVIVGKAETRILYLSNDSEREVAFCVMGDEQGIFQMAPKQGIIPPLIKQYPVKVVFRPVKPINYYRRFFVLVGDALPLFYDCLGTGYIVAKGEVKEQRPAPIRHAHVQAYRNRVVHNFGALSPDELDAYYENESVPREFFAQIGRVGTKAMSVTTLQRPVTRTGDTVRNLVAPAHEFFIEQSDATAREVLVNRTVLDFGYTPHHDVSAPQTIVIHNNTHGKVTVQWNVPVVHGMSPPEHHHSSRDREIITKDRAEQELSLIQAFIITPSCADINPNQSLTFNISFNPKQSSRNFLTELEGYVYFKNQRTFRLVNDYSLVPPWCVTVACMGHTFESGQLLAKAKFFGGNIRHSKLVFPCCFYGESLYQTIMLRNMSNLPCTFRIDLGWGGREGVETIVVENAVDDHAIFKVKPHTGEIVENGFVLICIRFTPRALKKYTDVARLSINGEPCGQLILEGSANVPFLTVPELLETKVDDPAEVWGLPSAFPRSIPTGRIGRIFMKPTSLGLNNSRTVTLKNSSRLPLKFKVALPLEASDILRVFPASGVLRGNDDIKLTLTFSPKEVKQYIYQLAVQTYPIGGKGDRVLDGNQPGPVGVPELLQDFSVEVAAQGEVGALVFDPAHTDVDVMLVHRKEEKDIFLENISETEVSYKLFYREKFLPDAVDEEPVETETDLLELQSILSHTKHGAGFEDSLFCEQPIGKIGARSRLRLLFTYRPVKSGLFNFSIFAQVQSLDSQTGQLISLDNQEAVRFRETMKDPSMDSNDLFMLPLCATLQARAAFPKLLFEDIRTDLDSQISDLEYLWQRFSFPRLNHDLSVPLTKEELALYNSSSPDLSRLEVYPFEFSPSVLHSPLQTITIQLKNHGYLETTFSVQLPNEKTLELENWCDEDEPSEELNKLICIIEELRLFTITPHHATLQPGETCTFTISYKHSSLKYNGIHNLPLLVRIAQGKQFYLDVRGRTLAPAASRRGSVKILDPKASITSLNGREGASTPHAQTPAAVQPHIPDILLVVGAARHDGSIHLGAIPIGLSPLNTYGNPIVHGTKHDSGPLQRIELLNMSAHTVTYTIFFGHTPAMPETIQDDYVLQQNFGMNIIYIYNSTGSIAPSSSVFIYVYAYVVEAKEYDIPIIVQYTTNDGVVYGLGDGGLGGGTMVDGSVASRGNASRRSNKRSRQKEDGHLRVQTPSSPQAPTPVLKYLRHTIHITGYDPRYPIPIVYESTYTGGLPPSRPILQHKPVYLYEDMVDFTIQPQRTISQRIVTLINRSPTNTFEFAVDETSCLLCHEGLLKISPTFGKILPGERVMLNLQFLAYCQPRVMDEKLKIMLREIVRTTNRSRGGAKQQLIDKLKARKSVNAPHESVVSRATFARSMQLVMKQQDYGRTNQEVDMEEDAEEDEYLEPAQKTIKFIQSVAEEGAAAGRYPSTVGKKGEVIQTQPSQYLLKNLQGFSSNQHGGTNVMTVNMSAIDEEKSGLFSGEMSRSNLMSQGDQRRLQSGGTSRSGLSSRISGGTTPYTGQGGGVTKFGVTYYTILRIKGEVYGEDTIRNVNGRACDKFAPYHTHTQPHTQMNAYLIPPNKIYLPPVGTMYVDDTYIQARNQLKTKSRVNIQFVYGRDQELRSITHTVVTKMLGLLLEQEGIREHLYDTLTWSNRYEVPMNTRPSLIPSICSTYQQPSSPSRQYGVYFKEVYEEAPLHYILQRELRHLGYLPPLTHTPSNTSSPLPRIAMNTVNLGEDVGVGGDKYEEGANSCGTITLHQLREALGVWGVADGEFIQACDLLEQEAIVNSKGSFSASAGVNLLSQQVNVSVFVYAYDKLSSKARGTLRRALDKFYCRRVNNKVENVTPEIEQGEESVAKAQENVDNGYVGEATIVDQSNVQDVAITAALPSSPFSPASPSTQYESPPSLDILVKGEYEGVNALHFPEMAAHALSAMMFDMLQQMIEPREVVEEGIE